MSAPKIGYVLKRYPRYSETFIVNEILAHEAAGQPIEIFSLRPVEETHFQDNLGKVRAPVTRLTERLKNPDALWRLMMRAGRAACRVLDPAGPDEEQQRPGRRAGAGAGPGLPRTRRGASARAFRHRVDHRGAAGGAAGGDRLYLHAHAKDIYFDYEEDTRLDEKLRDAAHVVTVSDYNVDYLGQRFGPAAANVSRIYNGLDLDRFTHADPAPDATDILAVGRLVEKKGFHILIEAVRLLRDQGRTVRCTIVGGGDEATYLSAQIAAADLGKAVTLAAPPAIRGDRDDARRGGLCLPLRGGARRQS